MRRRIAGDAGEIWQMVVKAELDKRGFRANVGIVVCNDLGQVLLAKRKGEEAWQFPQGGVDPGEAIQTAMFRELFEELGLRSNHVICLGQTRRWLYYRLPRRYLRRKEEGFVGQKQIWFLLKLQVPETEIKFYASNNRPEFDDWRWVSYWFPVYKIIDFKRQVYREMLAELLFFMPPVLPLR